MIFRLFLLNMFVFCNCVAQSQKVIRYISENVGLVTYKDLFKPNSLSTGTGTLILKHITENTGKIFLVTNKHVIPNFSQNDAVHFRIKFQSSFKDLIIPIYSKNGKYLENVKADPDGNDLVAIDITSKYESYEMRYLDSVLLDYSILATKEIIKNHEIGIGLLF